MPTTRQIAEARAALLVDTAPFAVRFDIHQVRVGKGHRFGGRWAKSLVGGSPEAEPKRQKLARELFARTSDSGLDEIRAVIDGTYAGLTVQVTMGEVGPKGFDVTANINGPDGIRVGKVRRIVAEDDAGNLYAEHSILQLDPHVQGQGFAEAFNAHLEDWYRQSGVERIELNADRTVGGYAWPRQGYDFRDGVVPRDVRDKLAAAIAERLPRNAADEYSIKSAYNGKDIVYDVHGPAGVQRFDFYDEAETAIAAALIDRFGRGPHADDDVAAAVAVLDRIDAGKPVTAFEISQVGREPGQAGPKETWIGKDAMLGSDWDGVKWLSPAASRTAAKPPARPRARARHAAAA
jgi:GNAT superfamily N-acetyltransferase